MRNAMQTKCFCSPAGTKQPWWQVQRQRSQFEKVRGPKQGWRAPKSLLGFKNNVFDGGFHVCLPCGRAWQTIKTWCDSCTLYIVPTTWHTIENNLSDEQTRGPPSFSWIMTWNPNRLISWVCFCLENALFIFNVVVWCVARICCFEEHPWDLKRPPQLN